MSKNVIMNVQVGDELLPIGTTADKVLIDKDKNISLKSFLSKIKKNIDDFNSYEGALEGKKKEFQTNISTLIEEFKTWYYNNESILQNPLASSVKLTKNGKNINLQNELTRLEKLYLAANQEALEKIRLKVIQAIPNDKDIFSPVIVINPIFKRGNFEKVGDKYQIVQGYNESKRAISNKISVPKKHTITLAIKDGYKIFPIGYESAQDVLGVPLGTWRPGNEFVEEIEETIGNVDQNTNGFIGLDTFWIKNNFQDELSDPLADLNSYENNEKIFYKIIKIDLDENTNFISFMIKEKEDKNLSFNGQDILQTQNVLKVLCPSDLPYITPQMCKFDSDGEDWSKAFERAINSGKIVFIPPGEYNFLNTVHINRDGTTIIGSGYDTIIHPPRMFNSDTTANHIFNGNIDYSNEITVDSNIDKWLETDALKYSYAFQVGPTTGVSMMNFRIEALKAVEVEQPSKYWRVRLIDNLEKPEINEDNQQVLKTYSRSVVDYKIGGVDQISVSNVYNIEENKTVTYKGPITGLADQVGETAAEKLLPENLDSIPIFRRRNLPKIEISGTPGCGIYTARGIGKGLMSRNIFSHIWIEGCAIGIAHYAIGNFFSHIIVHGLEEYAHLRRKWRNWYLELGSVCKTDLGLSTIPQDALENPPKDYHKYVKGRHSVGILSIGTDSFWSDCVVTSQHIGIYNYAGGYFTNIKVITSHYGWVVGHIKKNKIINNESKTIYTIGGQLVTSPPSDDENLQNTTDKRFWIPKGSKTCTSLQISNCYIQQIKGSCLLLNNASNCSIQAYCESAGDTYYNTYLMDKNYNYDDINEYPISEIIVQGLSYSNIDITTKLRSAGGYERYLLFCAASRTGFNKINIMCSPPASPLNHNFDLVGGNIVGLLGSDVKINNSTLIDLGYIKAEKTNVEIGYDAQCQFKMIENDQILTQYRIITPNNFSKKNGKIDFKNKKIVIKSDNYLNKYNENQQKYLAIPDDKLIGSDWIAIPIGNCQSFGGKFLIESEYFKDGLKFEVNLGKIIEGTYNIVKVDENGQEIYDYQEKLEDITFPINDGFDQEDEIEELNSIKSYYIKLFSTEISSRQFANTCGIFFGKKLDKKPPADYCVCLRVKEFPIKTKEISFIIKDFYCGVLSIDNDDNELYINKMLNKENDFNKVSVSLENGVGRFKVNDSKHILNYRIYATGDIDNLNINIKGKNYLINQLTLTSEKAYMNKDGGYKIPIVEQTLERNVNKKLGTYIFTGEDGTIGTDINYDYKILLNYTDSPTLKIKNENNYDTLSSIPENKSMNLQCVNIPSGTQIGFPIYVGIYDQNETDTTLEPGFKPLTLQCDLGGITLAEGDYIDYLTQKAYTKKGTFNVKMPGLCLSKGTNIINIPGASKIEVFGNVSQA